MWLYPFKVIRTGLLLWASFVLSSEKELSFLDYYTEPDNKPTDYFANYFSIGNEVDLGRCRGSKYIKYCSKECQSGH